MSRWERYGTRDMTFSGWHRTLPNYCTAIDLDFLEYCQKCRTPLALIELAQDVSQAHKPTRVMEELAKKADVPAYLILYKQDGEKQIGRCRVARIWPNRTDLKDLSANQVGTLIRKIHVCNCGNEKAK